ncbi:MAG: helicase-related protein [Candidatus Micrarchaeota archaeon]
MVEKNFKENAPAPRDYQLAIAEKAKLANTLVVLPTGMGKTLIAALVMAKLLEEKKKIILLAPTKPLAEQHKKTMTDLMTLDEGKIILITGAIPAKKRSELWTNATVALATPQTLENDLKRGRANLDGVGLVVFDEAHRCVGKYAYTYVAKRCKESEVLVLALTASPGATEQKIRAIMETLGIDKVEMRGEEDDDVKEYVQPVSVKWVEVELPDPINAIKFGIEALIEKSASMFVKLGLIGNPKKLSKKRLFELRKRIESSGGGWKYSALSRYAELFNLIHAHELLETQGVGTFLDFFARMSEREEKSKAVMRLLADEELERVLDMARATKIEHPKMGKLGELISERPNKNFIVFVQYRDQIKRLVEALAKLPGLKPIRFVGKKDGVSQKEQKETIERFRAGEYNVLVATQIGEEGLDIPSVDCVIFYEPVASEIRSIQRRGRTARTRAGEVIVLVTKGTRDEAYYWVSKKKERRMKRAIDRIKKDPEQLSAGKTSGEPPSCSNEDRQREKELKEHPGNRHSRGQTKISDYS